MRPVAIDGREAGGWLTRHRGSLGRCLPSVLVVGSQRSSLGSIHRVLRRGWYRQIRVNEGGERDVHFFSMDNRFKLGLHSHERRFLSNFSQLGGCNLVQPNDGVLLEVSSSYLDYPKAPSRVASVLPAVRVVIALREPVSAPSPPSTSDG